MTGSGSHPPGRVVTFYSFKGGTGRSMALANVACILASRPDRLQRPRVLAIDWDLEAPGLHRYFAAKAEQPEYARRPGVIEYFGRLQGTLRAEPALAAQINGPEGWRVLEERLPIHPYVIPEVVPGVDLMKAGRIDTASPRVAPRAGDLGYAALVHAFDWAAFYTAHGGAFVAFRRMLAAQYDYVLVDSRTGLTDTSGICTMVLPEKLVAVFTPNRQSLDGVVDLVAEAAKYRQGSNDFRPLAVYPLPSRIEVNEKQLRERWQRTYQLAFERLFQDAFGVDDCDLTAYFRETAIPHHSYFAYGEEIAALAEQSAAFSLRRAYETFAERLVRLDAAWEDFQAEPVSAGELSPVAGASLRGPRQHRYDVFLSYNTADRGAAEIVRGQLEAYGISSFFDASRDLAPGENWHDAVLEAMRDSAAVLVLLGIRGLSAAQKAELRFPFDPAVRRGQPRVIPVLLPGTTSDLLPTFLSQNVAVEFLLGLDDPDAIERIVWAVTGERPSSRTGPASDTPLMPTERRRVRDLAREEHSINRIAGSLVDGRATVFLGPQAAGAPNGDAPDSGSAAFGTAELTESLAREFGFPTDRALKLAEVAQFVVPLIGRSEFVLRLRDALAQTAPRPLHHFLARLARARRRRGPVDGPATVGSHVILTTNLDDATERAFAEASEPYSVLSYLGGRTYPNDPVFELRTEEGKARAYRLGEDVPNPPAGGVTIVRLCGSLVDTTLDVGGAVVTEDDHIDALLEGDVWRRVPWVRESVEANHRLLLGFAAWEWPSRGALRRAGVLRGLAALGRTQQWVVDGRGDSVAESYWSPAVLLTLSMDEFLARVEERILRKMDSAP